MPSPQTNLRRLGIERLESRLPLAASLLQDVNTLPGFGSANARDFMQAGDQIYFSADSIGYGTEIWKTDLTQAGTALAIDSVVGAKNSNSKLIGRFQDKLVYTYEHPSKLQFETVVRLAVTDGTESGTVVLADYVDTQPEHNRHTLSSIEYGGKLYFVAENAAKQQRLWVSDGTAQGTAIVDWVPASFNNSAPEKLQVVNGQLFALVGTSLWRTDGSQANTVLLDSSVSRFHVAGDQLFYFRHVAGEKVLHVSDGTVESIRLLRKYIFDDYQAAVSNNQLYFVYYRSNPKYPTLVRSDGTPEGTVDLIRGSSNSVIPQIVATKDRVFFVMSVSGDTYRLWESDGSTTGTKPMNSTPAEIDSGSATCLHANADSVYYLANQTDNSYSIWRTSSDGSLTEKLSQGQYGCGFKTVGDSVLFQVGAGTSLNEIWETKGTAGSTRRVAEFLHGTRSHGNTRAPADLNGRSYFVSNDGSSVREQIWSTDGTKLGTRKEFDLPVDGSVTSGLTRSGNKIYFSQNSPGLGNELWMTDGTLLGTRPVIDFVPGKPSSVFWGNTSLGDTYLSIINNKLLRTDGTEAGTYKISSAPGQPEFFDVLEMTSADGIAYFKARINGQYYPRETLWRTDGTSQGTWLLFDPVDIHPDASTFARFIVAGSYVYILSGSIWRLHRQHETLELGYTFTDIKSPIEIFDFNGSVVFYTSDLYGRNESLWRLDQNNALGQVYNFGQRMSFQPVIVGGLMFWLTWDPITKNSLWRSDGSEDGTFPLQSDIWYVENTQLIAFNDRLIFLGNDGIFGEEIWESDGSIEGTRRLTDLVPGGGGIEYVSFYNINSMLLFHPSETHGRELWRYQYEMKPDNVGLTSQTISEDVDVGSVVSALWTLDPNDDEQFEYELVPGVGDDDNHRFAIIGDQLLITSPLDYEAKKQLSIRVRSIDSAGLKIEKAILIEVEDRNEAPLYVSLHPVVVQENLAPSAAGTLQAMDPDSGDLFQYAIVPGEGDEHNEWFAIENNQLILLHTVNFETANSLSVRIQAKDKGELFVESVIEVFITDVNESPSLALTATAAELPESWTNESGRLLTEIQIVDDELGENRLSIVGDDATAFSLVGSSLWLRPGFRLDFEEKSTYRVAVQVEDATLDSEPYSVEFILSITDSNEPPQSIELVEPILMLPENIVSQSDIAIGDIRVVDDAIGSNLIELIGPDAEHFSMSENRVIFDPVDPIDFETKNNYRITLRTYDPSIVGATPVSVDYVLSVANAPEVEKIIDPNNPVIGSLTRQIAIHLDAEIEIEPGAFRLMKTDVNKEIDTTVSLINHQGSSVVLLELHLPFASQIGLGLGDYELSMDGTKVKSTTGVAAASYRSPTWQVQTDPADAEIKISLVDPIRWLQPARVRLELPAGVASPGEIVSYSIDLDADGLSDYSFQSGSQVNELVDILFEQPGSTWIEVKAESQFGLLAQGRAVVHVSPHNSPNVRGWYSALDTNRNGLISPSDALVLINILNDPQHSQSTTEFWLDVDRNQLVRPSDALHIINYLNTLGEPSSDLSALVMLGEGNVPGFTKSLAINGIANREMEILLSLDGGPKQRWRTGVIGAFAIPDSEIDALFGQVNNGNHVISIFGAQTLEDGVELSLPFDYHFVLQRDLGFEPEIIAAVVRQGVVTLQWTGVALPITYNLLMSVADGTPAMFLSSIAATQQSFSIPSGNWDFWIEAEDGAGNKRRSKPVRIFEHNF